MTELHADVVIVGLGAAGGIAANVLTDAGLDVVAIEAGPHIDASAASLDEIANTYLARLAEPKAKHEVPTWRFDSSEEAGPSPWPMLMVNAVGGTSIHYEGLSIRFSPWTFATRSGVLRRYGAGAIPHDATLVDWPFSYDDLEPFYDQVEYAIGVSGTAGSNAFEGARSREFPMPPLRPTGWSRHTAAAAERLGWHPFQAPASVNSVEFDGRPACTFCGFCRDNVCHCAAKGSTDVTVIEKAQASGHLTVKDRARVMRVDVNADGLAEGVTYVADGAEHSVKAKVVLLASYLYENTRLLLLSTSRAYPHGLSNNHGQVGKHYIAHVTPFLYGLFPDRRLNLFNGLCSQVTCVDDWNADNFDHSELGFIGGGMLFAGQEFHPIGFVSSSVPPSIPRWGSGWKGWLGEHAQSVGLVNLQFDALPYESHYLDLDPSAVDAAGVPVVRVTYRVRENEARGAGYITERMREWLEAAGASETWQGSPALPVDGRHAYGGTRMGDDPDSSVVDAHGFSHEVPNLGVLGASTFPTAGGHNPTLTVQAVAWRTAARLVEQWATIAEL